MNRCVLVKSCAKNQAKRNAVNTTWAHHLRYYSAGSVPVWIVQGGEPQGHVLDPGYSMRLCCGDQYGDNSLKLKTALGCLLAYDNSMTHVFICDDDTFVYPRRWLEHEPAGELEGMLHRPRLAEEIGLNDGRPWVNGGAGFWMSRRLCEFYVDETIARCSYDDVLVARVAQEHDIEITDRPDLYACHRYGSPNWRVLNDTQITCHPVEPAEMLAMIGTAV